MAHLTTPDLSNLIDHRNQQLWELVSKEYDISVMFHDNPEHHLYSQGKAATISIPRDNYSPASFSHELLHIYLDVKEFRLPTLTFLLLKENRHINSVLPEDLFHHIANVIDHTKMLPLFLNMGFSREDFLFDYTEFKCEEHHLTIIELGFQQGSLLRQAATDIFIGKFFAMKSCPNPNFVYTGHLSRLNAAEPILFAILEDFWSSVLELDIETGPTDIYLDIAGDFKDKLEAWLLSNTE